MGFRADGGERRFARAAVFCYSLSSGYGNAEMMPHTRRRPSMKSIHVAQRCSNCGTCCRNGGPSLHTADRYLVEQGFIHTRHLYTIRRGELARDPIRGGLVHADSDIIKIKGCGGRWVCRFLDPDSNRCRIYEHRPVECRELACWDTARIEQMYDRGRLARKDLLSGIEGLWELVVDHDRRCSHELIQRLRKDATGPDAAGARLRLAEICGYDAEIRRLMVSRGRLEAAVLDFLLGRPMEPVLWAGGPDGGGIPRPSVSDPNQPAPHAKSDAR